MYTSMSILCGKTGLPNELDLNEPERVAESVELMNLKHVVITAVARDDLRDQGSNVYAETVRKVRARNPFTTIEILPSDMGGDYEALETLMASRPDILNHNIETVRRLTPRVRARATYDRTLEFLRRSKELQPDIPTKSSLMVGLGKQWKKFTKQWMIYANDVDILTIGQYLQPSRKHLKVEKYYTPLEFGKMRKVAMDKGFKHCQAGPLVRSSYHADEQVNEAAKERQRQGKNN